MKIVTSAEFTRDANVIVKVKTVASFTESFGKQIPVTDSKEREQIIKIELADKSEKQAIVRSEVFAYFKNQGIEVYENNFNIL